MTVLRVGSLANTPLDRFNVLIVPSANGDALARELGEQAIERLQQWVQDGGTLITIGGATDFARSELDPALRSWYETDEGEDAQRLTVPGAAFNAVLDEQHWLSAGYEDGELPVLVTSNRVYLAPEGPPSADKRVAARFAPQGTALLSGHAWPESLERLPGAVFAHEHRAGRGRVIALAEDPNFRAYLRGANRLFLNAVVLGPSGP